MGVQKVIQFHCIPLPPPVNVSPATEDIKLLLVPNTVSTGFVQIFDHIQPLHCLYYLVLVCTFVLNFGPCKCVRNNVVHMLASIVETKIGIMCYCAVLCRICFYDWVHSHRNVSGDSWNADNIIFFVWWFINAWGWENE